MGKKVEVNLDTIITISAIYILLIGIVVFQRFQYSELFEEHISLQWTAQDAEFNVRILKKRLEKCTYKLEARNELIK